MVTPTAQVAFGALTQYECVYTTVRLAYGATVTDTPLGAFQVATPVQPVSAIQAPA